ncbi:MAG TPA: gluconate 2-dehydrogenase subunit 3 family protein [Vicinamibacterales bacterium]|nr:gluconate 2-dehydrogenase subunit 3 family protein [Vicinamibacterales bacterium]
MSGSQRISRRRWLQQIGIVGTAAVMPPGLGAPAAPAAEPAAPQAPAAAAREAFETLTAAESDTLDAMTARIIPSDASGPGAAEARAAHYIDRALAGPLAASRGAYTSGLATLDARALALKGASFARLAPADQDAVLVDLETTDPRFLNMVRAHTVEGTFSDPYYGGNANFVGWDLIGYPGVRVSTTPAEQQLDAKIAANHKSAYDFPMFSKRGGGSDGH